jgi:D-alanyl-D-alanine carboxypeptidase/D-alanyl-D-alanine-endopeptidase (penicillin-binding protein 4)
MLSSLLKFALGACAGAWLSMAGAQALPAPVVAALAQAGVPPDHVAMVVMPIPGRESVPLKPERRFIWRADAPMSPASVMKVVTTYAALDLLGPDYFWKTRLYTQGTIRNGTLHGNLLIRGSGDPKLVWDRLTELFDAAHAKGLKAVDGNILLDRSVFNLPPHDPAAFDDEPMRPYNAGPDGLLVNFKALTFKFFPTPGSARVRVESEPPIAGVRIPATVPAAKGACGDWRAHLQGHFSDPDKVTFAGRYARSCGDQEWSVAYVDPNEYAPRVIRALWAGTGGSVSGQVQWAPAGSDPADAAPGEPWVTGYSLPLSEIIADINQYSNNVMAQQVFLTLSDGPGGATFAKSIRAVDAWWQRTLARYPPPILDNGSGLSRDGRVTAGALAALLKHAAQDPRAADAFERSLPIAGVNGTARHLADRSPRSDAIGRARFKTGTLRDVVSLAGYAWGLSGQQYVVVGLVNDPNADAARPALDRLVEWAVDDQGALRAGPDTGSEPDAGSITPQTAEVQ